MTTDAIIREYLQRFGAQEVATLARDLKLTPSQVRASLKRLGASPRKFGDWNYCCSDGTRAPKHKTTRMVWAPWGKGISAEGPTAIDRFELWSLEPWRDAA
jgi:hypothetical protein